MKARSEVKCSSAATLSRRLRAGCVYRREDLASSSSAVDRHLKQLQDNGRVKKLSQGLYYVPKKSAYGALPPEDSDLVAAFLRDDDFLLLSPASYNTLELGTTQLYNRTIVYNHKRHGQFKLGNRTFDFRVRPRFPSKLSKEFLFVDLLNNLNEMTEEKEVIFEKAANRCRDLDRRKLSLAATKYGNVSTKKLIRKWLDG